MTAISSAGGGAMMMWVASHNAKSQERANEAVDKARDMLDVEKKITEFRQKLNASGVESPEELQELSAEINAYIEANKDSPFYGDIKEQMGPMADSLAYRAAKGTIARLGNNEKMSEKELAEAREAVKNESFRANFPQIAEAIENGQIINKNEDGRGYLVTASGEYWLEIDACQTDGKGDDGADELDRGDAGPGKELERLRKNTEDLAGFTSKEREMQMAEASEKRDMARQTSEQGAKLISSMDKSQQDIISTVYRA